MNLKDAKAMQIAPLNTPTDLRDNAVTEISGALTTLLAEATQRYISRTVRRSERL